MVYNKAQMDVKYAAKAIYLIGFDYRAACIYGQQGILRDTLLTMCAMYKRTHTVLFAKMCFCIDLDVVSNFVSPLNWAKAFVSAMFEVE